MILLRATLVLLFTFFFFAAAHAQSSQAHGNHLYGAFGIGERTPINLAIAEIAVGFEQIFPGGLGAGAEIAYLSALSNLTSRGVGPVSLDASYHFRARDRVDPYIRGGYTGFLAFDAANGMNFGGGLNYWLNNRVALRVEFVDQIALESRNRHYLLGRIGFTFGHR